MRRIAVALALALPVLAWGIELPPIVVDPMVDWITLAPGGSYAGSFTITNLGDKPVALRITLVDFTLDESGGFVSLVPGTLGERSLGEYLVYTPDRLTVEGKETATVRYWVNLPPDATAPAWAALLVSPEEAAEAVTTPSEEGGLGFVVKVEVAYAVAILRRVPNPPPPQGQVVGMRVQGATAPDGTREVAVELAFQNLTDDIVQCLVYLEIRDSKGSTIARHEICCPPRTVLPLSLRVFTHTFTGLTLPPGDYLILGIVDYGGASLTAGQYLARVRE